MSWRVLSLLLLLAAIFSVPAEARRHRKQARKPAASDPLTDPTRVCVTAAQYKRMSKFPIKAGSESFIIFQSYGGIRYGFFAE